jgi:ATP-dependent exoDNAse (exonuclease V) alpha subunit
MMSKELAYTGFTRAEKRLDIFGNENMLRLAPTKSVIKKRYTNLKKNIEELKTNCKIFDVIKVQ